MRRMRALRANAMQEEETQDFQDALASVREMNVKLKIFEGPLDLLLFLIRKSEIDIYDIPIAEVTSQYMEVLRSMKEMSLEIAGEFFVMAATLMYIKSRMLLPTDERPQQQEDEENLDIDPRWQLVEQLLEYKKAKQASQILEDMIALRQSYGERRISDAHMLKAERPVAKSDRMELWSTFNIVLRRLAEKLVEGRITSENVTVADRMEYILSVPERTFTFTSLFRGRKVGIQSVVATFLALLELARLRRIRLEQNASFDEILCERIDQPEEPLSEGGLEAAAEPDKEAAGDAGNGAKEASAAETQ